MWISDLRLVLPDHVVERGALQLKDGVIAALVEGDAPAEALSLPGLTAIPGIIDLHGDMLERDIEPRPNAVFPVELGLYELDKRLASTGVTTAYAAISFAWRKGKSELRRQENAIRIINALHQQRPHLLIDMRVHARFEISNPDTVGILTDLLRDAKVQLISLMDHTPGQGQYGDLDRYVSFMHRWLGVDASLIGDDVLDKVKANMRAEAANPRDWDLARDLIELAQTNHIPIASHDDDTPEKVARMAELGVTISEFPVSLAAAQEACARGMHVVMGAPNAYRGVSNSNNLSALDGIRAGHVDSLATDYFPAAPLQAAFRIAAENILPLHEAINLVTKNPADAVGLSDRGQLAVGLTGDVALVAEDHDHPRVHAVFRGGVPIYWDLFMVRMSQGTLLQHLEMNA